MESLCRISDNFTRSYNYLKRKCLKNKSYLLLPDIPFTHTQNNMGRETWHSLRARAFSHKGLSSPLRSTRVFPGRDSWQDPQQHCMSSLAFPTLLQATCKHTHILSQACLPDPLARFSLPRHLPRADLGCIKESPNCLNSGQMGRRRQGAAYSIFKPPHSCFPRTYRLWTQPPNHNQLLGI